jgi:hypothetical protein
MTTPMQSAVRNLNPTQNRTICVVKRNCCTTTLLHLAAFVVKTIKREPFAGNEWLAKKVKSLCQK